MTALSFIRSTSLELISFLMKILQSFYFFKFFLDSPLLYLLAFIISIVITNNTPFNNISLLIMLLFDLLSLYPKWILLLAQIIINLIFSQFVFLNFASFNNWILFFNLLLFYFTKASFNIERVHARKSYTITKFNLGTFKNVWLENRQVFTTF